MTSSFHLQWSDEVRFLAAGDAFDAQQLHLESVKPKRPSDAQEPPVMMYQTWGKMTKVVGN